MDNIKFEKVLDAIRRLGADGFYARVKRPLSKLNKHVDQHWGNCRIVAAQSPFYVADEDDFPDGYVTYGVTIKPGNIFYAAWYRQFFLALALEDFSVHESGPSYGFTYEGQKVHSLNLSTTDPTDLLHTFSPLSGFNSFNEFPVAVLPHDMTTQLTHTLEALVKLCEPTKESPPSPQEV